MDANQVQIDAAFKEYSSLWEEKRIHKLQVRKIELVMFYFSSLVSLALYAAQPEVMAWITQGTAASEVAAKTIQQNVIYIAAIVCVPAVPILCVLFSFSITETFHVYSMGAQIGQLEMKINHLLGDSDTLTWESRACPIIYGGQHAIGEKPLTNVITINMGAILTGFAVIVAVLSFLLSHRLLSDLFKSDKVVAFYMIVCAYFVAMTIYSAYKLFRFTRADAPLKERLTKVHQPE